MATPIQSAHGQGSGDSLSVSFATAPTVGNIVIAVAVSDGSSIATDAVTDNKGNTYTQDASAPGASAECAIHRCTVSASGGTFTVTMNPVGTSAFQDLAIMEYAASAFDTTAIVNKTFIGTETTTATPTTASGATTAQCTIIGGVTHSGGTQTITPGATYTQILEDENATNMPINVEYKSVAAGTYSANWTLASATNSQTVAVAYKEAAASTNYSRVIGESVTVIDSPIREASMFRLLQDNLAVTESLSALVTAAAIVRRLLDSVTATDLLARNIIAVRQLSDSVTSDDVLGRVVQRLRVLSDLASISDLSLRVLVVTKILSEFVEALDSLASMTARDRVLADTVAASDTTIRMVQALRILSDSISPVDSLISLFVPTPTALTVQAIIMRIMAVQEILLQLDVAQAKMEIEKSQVDLKVDYDD